MRELQEETGVDVQSVGPCIARREFLWQMPDGETVLAVENYYVVHACIEKCSSAAWSDQERSVVCEVRWWSETELASCDEDIYPPDLTSLFAEALLIGGGRTQRIF